MAIFRHNLGAAVYKAFMGFNHAFQTTDVKGTALALARLDAGIPSVIEPFVEKDIRNGRRRKEYNASFRTNFRVSINQIKGSVCQFGPYWHLNELRSP